MFMDQPLDMRNLIDIRLCVTTIIGSRLAGRFDKPLLLILTDPLLGQPHALGYVIDEENAVILCRDIHFPQPIGLRCPEKGPLALSNPVIRNATSYEFIRIDRRVLENHAHGCAFFVFILVAGH
jgi:hypothetical protein